ncbi:MAG: PEP-CTERM sorting domain-containing protein [Terriglobales bacterium]
MAFLLLLAFLVAPTAAVADNIEFTAINGTWSWICVIPDCSDNPPLNATLGGLGGLVVVSLNGGPPVIIPGSVMSITTGAWSGGLGTPLDPFTFDPGGSITVSGCIANCFEGSFTSLAIVVDNQLGTITLTGNFVGGVILANGFGLPEGPATGSITVTLFGTVNCIECRGDAGSADLALVSEVPEPASLALLGTGLLGLASRFRKKFSA